MSSPWSVRSRLLLGVQRALARDPLVDDLVRRSLEADLARGDLAQARDKRLVLAAHDISDGGIAIAISEMAFKNKIGFEVNIQSELRPDIWLFSETGGFVIEVELGLS